MRRKPPVPHYLGVPIEDWGPAVRASFADIYPENPVVAIVVHKLKPHRTRTRHNVLETIALFQGSIRETIPDLAGQPLEGQISAATVRAFAERLSRTNSPQSVVDHLGRLVTACRRLAMRKKAVDVDCVELERALVDVPAREKIVPGATTRELYEAGQATLERAIDRLKRLPPGRREQRAYLRRTAEIYRDGLLVCLLALCPIRLASLVLMQLDRHVRRSQDHWRIVLTEAETKTARALVRRVPNQLRVALDRYVETFRPLIQGAVRHEAMWPSRAGAALSAIGIYLIITKLTEEYLGVRIRPHDARRAAGNAAASAPGAKPEAVQILLDHGDASTSPTYVTVKSDAGSSILSALTGC